VQGRRTRLRRARHEEVWQRHYVLQATNLLVMSYY
jgi:hypothetical protein